MKWNLFKRRDPITVHVIRVRASLEEADVTALQKQMDRQIDKIAELFTERLAGGETFESIMLDLGHEIIDDPMEWPREAIAMLALRACSRTTPEEVTDAQD